jgi:protein SCO1/2
MRQQRNSRSPTQKLALFTAAVLAVYVGYYWGSQHGPRELPRQALSQLQDPVPIQSLQLLDQFGNAFTAQRLHGHWNLLFFGYRNSEQSTPALLTLAVQIVNRLAERRELQENLQVIFVTLDPDRDKPEVLQPFVGHYHPDFLALTGPMDEIRHLARQLGVQFQRQDEPSREDYRIDHSTNMALIDPKGRTLGLFTGVVDAVTIASDLKLIAETE